MNSFERAGPVQNFYKGSGLLPTVERGEGIYLYDNKGKRYIDASSGPVTCNLGHGNRAVIEAMHKQAKKVCFASYNFFENEPNKNLAKQLISLSGQNFDQAFFVSGGSEAIEAAFKLARQYAISIGEKNRFKILARTPSYHGSTLGAFSASSDPEMEDTFRFLTRILPKVPAPFTYRVPENFNVGTYAEYCADELERKIIDEGSENVLAFIVEPVGGLASGALVSTELYYKKIREICSKYGILLIFDEVMSGAGRTGTFLAADHWPESTPDIVVLAKGLCAGYSPLGALIAPNRIVMPIVNNGGFLHGHTYASNPLSCAVAEAVLSELIKNNLMKKADHLGTYLKAGLEKLSKESRIIGDVRGKGLLLAIEIVKDKTSKEIFNQGVGATYRIAQIGVEKGILLYTRRTARGIFGEWLMITPPLISSYEDIDLILNLLKSTLSQFESEVRE